jgi:purine-binding chemotaxis protein CheW
VASQVLVYRVAGHAYAVPIADVIETMRALPLKYIAGAADSVLGMSIIRGIATPVIDAGRLFGERPTAAERLITLRVGSRVVALAVDEVVGVRSIEAGQAPAPVLGAGSRSLEQIAMLDGELLLVLQRSVVISDELLATLTRATDA